MATRHFTSLLDCTPAELDYLIQRAIHLKQQLRQAQVRDFEPFKNRVLGMIFEKSSTRTRVSFESAMAQCGGHAIFLSSRDTQLGRGESIEDTAKVLSRMVDAIMIRTYAHQDIEQLAAHSSVPVINALSDSGHPCQVLADMQTYFEHRGSIAGHKVAWFGDGNNNMCASYIHAAIQFDFKLCIASPAGYAPDPALLALAGSRIELTSDPRIAATDAQLLVTDVWASMGKENELEQRKRALAPYQITSELLAKASPNAVFMHCLPAHRGEEVAAEVIDGAQSLVWDESENRLHAQKALLEFLWFGEQPLSSTK